METIISEATIKKKAYHYVSGKYIIATHAEALLNSIMATLSNTELAIISIASRGMARQGCDVYPLVC
jgi:hypothetical protein